MTSAGTAYSSRALIFLCSVLLTTVYLSALFLSAIVLLALWLTASDYTFSIFNFYSTFNMARFHSFMPFSSTDLILFLLELGLWCLTSLSTIFQCWRSVLLVEETGVPSEILRPAVHHSQTLSHYAVSSFCMTSNWPFKNSTTCTYLWPSSGVALYKVRFKLFHLVFSGAI